jgi:hypothetical protein
MFIEEIKSAFENVFDLSPMSANRTLDLIGRYPPWEPRYA